ncbi:MAG: hypothetical protein A3B30_02390 [Candidatus Komeilibacteria bacterium RIFCSPLOWO2_01_FULL_52_15]|uniref:Four helix bundle protein n=2 Tax=Candidatus Komeiliibacteriota TaxID=1817908 RepID=A0A1G2BS87_9BACT|nr:MAG: hypothetical protein A2677_03920 [Candidatus Komeilibacteria bacterium RIFCSPHIGHO2_01_FULL_52_14]OGY91912.1 MAG: hypothetical protein A3B30_02390 [Candidatus Komeilibacteria bacterium RIFCSPLOWO2_01_FULL_52_15]
MQHQNAARGSWFKLSLAEQLGNVGSEYDRASKWRKQNDARFQNAFDRFLELLDLTIADGRHSFSRKRELLRLRETACSELTQTTDTSVDLSNYFHRFALLARKAV